MTPPSTSRRARTAVAVTAACAALLLTGCGAAEEAVQGAADSASQKASEAVESAKSRATEKATELAADAARTQLCNLVEDGSVSDADITALKGLLPAAEAAGVPASVLEVAKKVAADGTSAANAEVSDLKAKACAPTG